MSDEKPKLQLTETNSVSIGCAACEVDTTRSAVHLPSGLLVSACVKCGNVVSAVPLAMDGYRWAVNAKLAQSEPSRIVVPKIRPVPN